MEDLAGDVQAEAAAGTFVNRSKWDVVVGSAEVTG